MPLCRLYSYSANNRTYFIGCHVQHVYTEGMPIAHDTHNGGTLSTFPFGVRAKEASVVKHYKNIFFEHEQ